MTDYLIRLETAGDRKGIEELLLAAFPTSYETRLVRQLREDDDLVFSLVAAEAADVIGHALFSRLRAPTAARCLAPVAVTARRRRRGVAAALIEAGVERARFDGWAAVVVLGDPSAASLDLLKVGGTYIETETPAMFGWLGRTIRKMRLRRLETVEAGASCFLWNRSWGFVGRQD